MLLAEQDTLRGYVDRTLIEAVTTNYAQFGILSPHLSLSLSLSFLHIHSHIHTHLISTFLSSHP